MMSDDFSVFWRNNERASALFYDLLARAERGAYDDDFLAQLAAYREAEPRVSARISSRRSTCSITGMRRMRRSAQSVPTASAPSTTKFGCCWPISMHD